MDRCSVCQEEITKCQEFIALACQHSFHPECIQKWFFENEDCPNCRRTTKSVLHGRGLVVEFHERIPPCKMEKVLVPIILGFMIVLAIFMVYCLITINFKYEVDSWIRGTNPEYIDYVKTTPIPIYPMDTIVKAYVTHSGTTMPSTWAVLINNTNSTMSHTFEYISCEKIEVGEKTYCIRVK